MFKSRARAIAGLAVLSLVAVTCDEFADAPPNADLFLVNIVPQSPLPGSVLLGASETVSVDVVDRAHTDRKLEGLNVTWSTSGAGLGVTAASGSGGYSATLQGGGVGTAALVIRASGDAIRTDSITAQIQVRAAGVDLTTPTATDTTLQSLYEAIELSARALNSSGGHVQNTGLSWRVAGDGAVVVTSSGTVGDGLIVESRGPGVDTVYVSLEYCEGTCERAVVVRVEQVADTIWAPEDSVRLESLQEVFELTLEGEDANGHAVVGGPAAAWSLVEEADSLIVSLTPEGELTTLANGTVEVLATVGSGDDARTATVTVEVEQVLVGGLMSADTVLFESMGQRDTLTFTPVDANDQAFALDFEMEWESSDDAVVGVTMLAADSTRAEIEPRTPGTAWIFASANGVLGDSVFVEVAPKIASLAVTPNSATMTSVGDTLGLTVLATDEDGFPVTGLAITWTSSDTDVAVMDEDVDGNPVVVAVAEGIALIVATEGSVADTATITVDQEVVTLEVSPGVLVLIQDDEVALTAEPQDGRGNLAPNDMPDWESDNELVVTVDGDGNLVAVGEGTATVTATAPSGVTATVDVTVGASGVLAMDLADAPGTYLSSARLYVARVLVPDSMLDGPQRVITDTPFSEELLNLVDGASARMGAVRVPVGDYDGAILEVDSLVLQLKSGFTFGDATTRRKIVPSPRDLLVRFASDLPVVAEDTLVVVADFDLEESVRFSGEPPLSGGSVGDVFFRPVIRGVDQEAAAVIEGAVSTTADPAPELERLSVFATRDVGGERVDTLGARVKSDGSYALHWLPAGSYDLRVRRVPACHIAAPAVINAVVSASQVLTAQDFSIDAVQVDSVVIAEGGTTTLTALGQTLTLNGAGYADDLELEGIALSWSTSDAGVVSLPQGQAQGESIVITAVAPGSATVTLESCGVTFGMVVTVSQIAEAVNVSPDTANVPLGDTLHLAAAATDANGHAIDAASHAEGFAWSSSDDEVAAVDEDGVVSGVSTGTAWIRAEMDGIADSALIRVELPPGVLVQRRMAMGWEGGCRLTSFGTAECWGQGAEGQLGDGTSGTANTRPTPEPVSGNIAFANISGGNASHYCGVATDGTGYCWGAGLGGQIGDADFANRSVPTPVSGGHTFREIAAGHSHSCGITVAGEAYCWGNNGNGQLGTGTFTSQSSPTAVTGDHEFVRIDAGDRFTCGLTADGEIYCWGMGSNGRNGSFSTQTNPFLVPGGHTWKTMNVGDHTVCAINSNDDVYCWGSNFRRVAGHSGGDNSTPQLAGGGLKYESVSVGQYHTCARATVLDVCWGQNDHGQLGTGTTGNEQASPQPIASAIRFTEFAVGNNHACALTATGAMYCWGARGEGGAMGDGGVANHRVPAPAVTGVTIGDGQMALGQRSGCALDESGAAWCWGYNGEGQAGDGTTTARQTPVAVSGGHTFTMVDAGHAHACGLTADGDIYCWGGNWRGMLGDSTFTTRLTPVKVVGGHEWAGVAVGNEFNCGWTTDGEAYCWGRWDNRRIGLPVTQDQHAPVALTIPSHLSEEPVVVRIAAGESTACALLDTEELVCWGNSGWGQGGFNSASGSTDPTVVWGDHAWKDVSVGNEHTCAVRTDGQPFCWGRGGEGRLGTSNFNTRYTPTEVSTGLEFVRVSAGSNQTCGLTATGLALCWGANFNGALGNNSYDHSNTPVIVAGGVTFTHLTHSRYWNDTSCGVDDEGQAWCWGSMGWDHSVAGNGSYNVVTRPRLVIP